MKTKESTEKIIQIFRQFYRMLLILFMLALATSNYTKNLLQAHGQSAAFPVEIFGEPMSSAVKGCFNLFGLGAYFIPIMLFIIYLFHTSLPKFSRKSSSVFSKILDYFGGFSGISALSALLATCFASPFQSGEQGFADGQSALLSQRRLGGIIGDLLLRLESSYKIAVKPLLVIILFLCLSTILRLFKEDQYKRLNLDFWELEMLKMGWRSGRLFLKKFFLSLVGLAPWQKRIYTKIFNRLVPANGEKVVKNFFISSPLQPMHPSPNVDESHPQSFHPADQALKEEELKTKNGVTSKSPVSFCPSIGVSNQPRALKEYPPINLSTYFERFPEEHKELDFSQFSLPAVPEALIDALKDFKIEAEVEKVRPGPLISRYELKLGRGMKAAKLFNINYDLARALAVPAVTIGETVSGTNRINVDLANPYRQIVRFPSLLYNWALPDQHKPLEMILGVKGDGSPQYTDLASMPHLLVCGMTGSGKSETLHSLILSLLLRNSPEELRFLFIDPKMVEFSLYEQLPHLLYPIVTDTLQAREAFAWCIQEMEYRYCTFFKLKVRNLEDYNARIESAICEGSPLYYCPAPEEMEEKQTGEKCYFQRFPRIVLVVDELADLMLTLGKSVEPEIIRLAQKSRAVGIHLILATQRPSVDILTGSLKANIPTRLALTVASKIDSRIILDQPGAETLLGRGDMLFQSIDSHKLIRVHGGKVPDSLIRFMVESWKERVSDDFERSHPFGAVSFSTGPSAEPASGANGKLRPMKAARDNLNDPLLEEAHLFLKKSQRVSVSALQRHLRIGYNRASRLMEQLQTQGIVSAPDHLGKRKLLSY